MKMFRFKKCGFLTLVFFTVIFFGFHPGTINAETPTAISFGTSSVGSAFYTLSVVIANIITKNSGITVTVEPVGGSDATVRGISAKKVEMGMLNASSVEEAYSGTGSFAKTGKIPLALLAQGQDSLRMIIFRSDSGIKTIKDLAGKKFIARRRALPEMEKIADILLESYGVDKKSVSILETPETNEAIEALKVGTADAAIIPGGVPASYLLDLARSTKVTFFSLPDDKLKIVYSKMGSAFHTGFVPANTYSGQNYEVKAPAMASVIVVGADMPEESVYRITKAIFTNFNEIKAGHSAGKDWNLKKTLDDPPIPFHPGAIRYFKEVGAWGKK
jgi:TRAP transporter TAXI family solute receptor